MEIYDEIAEITFADAGNPKSLSSRACAFLTTSWHFGSIRKNIWEKLLYCLLKLSVCFFGVSLPMNNMNCNSTGSNKSAFVSVV